MDFTVYLIVIICIVAILMFKVNIKKSLKEMDKSSRRKRVLKWKEVGIIARNK